MQLEVNTSRPVLLRSKYGAKNLTAPQAIRPTRHAQCQGWVTRAARQNEVVFHVVIYTLPFLLGHVKMSSVQKTNRHADVLQYVLAECLIF